MEASAPGSRHLSFLFADVEGSTRIAERHGEAAGAALARYHALVAECAERQGGRIFERIGDAAYASFDDPVSAVTAADEIQAALGSEDWGPIGRLRARVAVTSGEVQLQGDRYYGRPLFRASRILGLAAGGETFVAGPTVDGARWLAPPGHRPA